MWHTAAAQDLDPTERLELGLSSYDYSDYKQTIEYLAPLVVPDRELLTEPVNLVSAYEKLGLAHFYLGEKTQARAVFERLIRFRPDHQLNPALVPPKAILFFKEIRRDLEDELEKDREVLARKIAEYEAARKAKESVTIEVDIRRNSRLVAAVPFGVGQFQNEDVGWGLFFLSSEIVAIGASVGFFAAVENLRGDDGRFASRDYTRANELQSAQLISAGAAVALIVAGIVHAQLTFDEETRINRRVRGPTEAKGLLNWEF